MGASAPIYILNDIFAVPVVGLPIVHHHNNQHASKLVTRPADRC